MEKDQHACRMCTYLSAKWQFCLIFIRIAWVELCAASVKYCNNNITIQFRVIRFSLRFACLFCRFQQPSNYSMNCLFRGVGDYMLQINLWSATLQMIHEVSMESYCFHSAEKKTMFSLFAAVERFECVLVFGRFVKFAHFSSNAKFQWAVVRGFFTIV